MGLQVSEFIAVYWLDGNGNKPAMKMPGLTKTKITTGTKRDTKLMTCPEWGWFGKRH